MNKSKSQESKRSTAPKSRTKRSKVRRQRNPAQFSLTSVPTNQGTVMKPVQGSMFGAAAPHDDFPEGGMRVSGVQSPYVDDTVGVYGGSSYTGALSASAGTPGGRLGFPVSPTFSSNTNGWTGGTVFGITQSGPMYYLAYYFKFFRFRKLSLIYTGACSSATTGSVQVSLHRDFAAAQAALSRTSIQTNASEITSVRFPAWTQRVVIPLIAERKHSGADNLWQVVAANSAVVTNSALRLVAQGAVTVLNDQGAAVSGATWGHFQWEYVLDLYGLGNLPADTSLTALPPDEKPASQREKEFKAESSDSELVDLPPVPMKRTTLGVHTDLPFTPANMPAGSKTVKSQSLK